ncbi:hypothetical protein PoB_000130500 [Plakobranchus ocellatus]|uniref:Uncharacterized protein n=1 Tax=Plakobranchus ocellatus TaxID=259542 RepID=A0AAV3XWK4_9GAST|nr:hypothetical protein PoB_000130500 [Plakobranchus ocellatus]
MSIGYSELERESTAAFTPSRHAESRGSVGVEVFSFSWCFTAFPGQKNEKCGAIDCSLSTESKLHRFRIEATSLQNQKFIFADPQQGDLRLSGPPFGQGTGGGARTRDRRVPADLRADSLVTVPPTPHTYLENQYCTDTILIAILLQHGQKPV